jgi:RHS repeat-associated protein
MKRHRVAATCFLGIALLVLLASAAPAQTPPLLDNFNRPDEDPLSGGGNWAQTDSGGWPTPMRLLNNSATRGTNTSASYWTQMSFQGGEGSVWARSGNLGVGGAPGVGIALYKEVGGASAADGYEFRRTAGGAAGSRRDALWRVTNGARVQEIAAIGSNGPGTNESYFNLRRIGDTVEGWTSANGTSWTLRLSATDATHTTGTYRASIHANSTATGQFVDDFGAAPGGQPEPATLIVAKTVVNDDGGSAVSSDWTMNVAGPTPLSFPGAPAPGTSNTVETGTYAVTESGGPGGYTLSYSGDCDANGNVTLAQGQSKTCVLTNDDLAAPPSGPPTTQTYGAGAGGRGVHGWCGCALFADPVSSRTGAFTTSVDDLATPGTGVAFGWSRSYTSADPTVGRLGPGWTDSYSASLEIEPNGDVLLHGEDGQQLSYALQGDGSFAGAAGSLSTLAAVAGGYELERTDQVAYAFTAAGRLLSIKDRMDQGVTLAYDGQNRLSTITDAAGKQVTVAYNASNLVSTVSTQDGRSVSYGYVSGRLTSVIDVRGKPWTYAYDAGGRLASIRDPLNHAQVTNVYDANGRVQTQTDAMTKPTTFAWDPATEIATATDANQKPWKHDYDEGVLAKEIDPLDHVTELGHDDDLNTDAVTSPTNEQTQMSYDAAGNLLTATAPPSLGSAQKTFTYNARNDPELVTDARGKVTDYVYNPTSGNLTSLIQDGVQVGAYTYDSAGRVRTFTDGNEKTTTYAYFPATGYLESATDALGNKTTYTYDPAGRVATRVDPKGNVVGCGCSSQFTWTYTYNPAGQQLSEQDPLGHQTTNVYDDAGRLTSATDANGHTTSYAYDDANRLLTETGPDPDGGGPQQAPVTTYAYDNVGNKLTETGPDPDGAGPLSRPMTTFAYTDANQLASEAGPDPDGAGPLPAPVTTHQYDDNGNLWKTVEPRGNVPGCNCAGDYTTVFTYDAAGRLKTETRPDPDGPGGSQLPPKTTNTYDPVGNLASVKDGNDHVTSYSYDAAGRILTATAPDTGVTTYTYDDAGSVKTRRDDNQHTTTYVYDDAGRLASETGPDPDGGGPQSAPVTSYTYDPNGNRLTMTDPNGNATGTAGDGVTTYGYDRANRLTSIDYSDQTSDVSFTYDGVGNRLTMADGSGTETRSYDGLDRLLTVTRGSNAFSYLYDGAGNVTRRTYPGNVVADYAYDALDRLSTVTSGGQTTSYAYDVSSNLTQTTLPSGNGYVETRTYDRPGRLVEVESKKGTSTLSKFALALDPVGNPLQIVRTGSLAQTQSYAYDANDRLTSVCFQAGTCPGAQDPFIRWSYDRVGNRLSEERPAGTTSYGYDARDRLLSAGATSYTYDQNGNELSAGSRTFAYDLANRLRTTFQGGTTTTYSYDGEGVRLQASTGSQANRKTSFLWDTSFGLPQIAQERDGNNALLRRYVYGVHRISQTAGSSTSYYLRDGLGSSVNLTSSAGQTQWTWSYEPFGSVRTETKASGNQPENLMRFTGEYLHPTGLYHLRARQYDPAVGRFLTRDPADQTVSQTVVSGYAYVANRPTAFVDPSGEVFVPSNRAKISARLANSLARGVSMSPSGDSYRRADGCARRVSGSSGYERYSVSFPAARLLPFPFHVGLNIDAFPHSCRGNKWTLHWWARVDTSALTGPFGEFGLITAAAIRGDAGGWRTLGTLQWSGGLNPSRDYWGTHRERYSFVSVDPPRQFDRGRLVLAVRRDQELGIFLARLPLQKTVEFPLNRR